MMDRKNENTKMAEERHFKFMDSLLKDSDEEDLGAMYYDIKTSRNKMKAQLIDSKKITDD